MVAEVPKAKAGAFLTNAPHEPLPPPQPAEDVALRTILLDDVPLLDSPEWSSDDELDNPTYNKRFRHKKHEEIRQRLLQKRLEERERQVQLAKDHKRAPTPQPTAAEETKTAAAAPSQPDDKLRPPHPSSCVSSHAGSQPQHALERTKTNRSKRSRRSNNSRHSHRRREHVKSSTDTVTDAGERAKSGAAAPAPIPVSVPQPIAPKADCKATLAKESAPPPAASATTAAATAVRSPTPNKQIAPAARAEHASGSSPVSPSQTQTPGTVSSSATPSHSGTPQQAQELCIPTSGPHPSPAKLTQISAGTRGRKATTTSPAVVAVTAISSTEVQPPKARASQSPASKLSVAKIVKSTLPMRSTTEPASTSPSSSMNVAAATAVPPAPSRQVETRAAAPPHGSSPTKVLATPTVAHSGGGAGASAKLASASNFDDLASMLEGLDRTHTYIELESSANEVREKLVDTRGAAQRSEEAPSCLTTSQSPGKTSKVILPPSPPLFPDELQEGHQRSSGATTTTASVTTVHHQHVRGDRYPAAAVRPASRVERTSRPGSRLQSTCDKHLRQSDVYTLSRMQSYYQYLIGDAPQVDGTAEHTAAVAANTAQGRSHKVADASRRLDASTAAARAAAELPGSTQHSATTTMTEQVIEEWDRNGGSFQSRNGNYYTHSGGHYEYIGNDISQTSNSSRGSGSSGYEESDGHDSGSWSTAQSYASAGTDLDHILEYHSSYYRDWMKLADSPTSRETFSAAGDAERNSEADALTKSDGGRASRRGAPAVHFHGATDEQLSKPASKESTGSTRSSTLSSLHPVHNMYDSEEETVPRTATPPMYSFYTSFQAHAEAERKKADEWARMSGANLGKDPYLLGVEDYVTMATNTAATAAPEMDAAAAATGTTKLPPILGSNDRRASGPTSGQPLPRRGNSSSTVDDNDPWAYHRAKRESWPSITRPGAGPAAATRTKSSSMISAEYSVLSFKRGLFAQHESKPAKPTAAPALATAAAQPQQPPQSTTATAAAVRVLSLEGSLPPSRLQPQPAVPPVALGIKPVSLDDFSSQTTNDSKSFDLLSPISRKTTAPPEGLALTTTEEEEGEEAAGTHNAVLPTHLMERQVRQSQQQALFSFAGLQYHPPAAFHQKKASAAAAAPAPASAPGASAPPLGATSAAPPAAEEASGQTSASPTRNPGPLTKPVSPSAARTPPSSVLQAVSERLGEAEVAATATGKEVRRKSSSTKGFTRPLPPSYHADTHSDRSPSPALDVDEAPLPQPPSHSTKATHTKKANTQAVPRTQSPHDMYLPIAGAEVEHFRSLFGSAYLTEVYTSSLRLLANGRRPETDTATAEDGIAAAGATAPASGDGWVGRAAPNESVAATRDSTTAGALPAAATAPRSHVPAPPTAQRWAELHSRGSNNSAPAAEAFIHVLSTQPSTLSFGGPTLSRVSLEDSAALSKSTIATTTMTTGRSPRHRYRRRHLAARIEGLVEEVTMRGSFLSTDGAPPSPVRVAAQASSGRASDSCHTWDGIAASQITGRLPSSEESSSRVLGAAGTGHGSSSVVVVPVRSGSSFVRMTTAPVLPSSSPSQLHCGAGSTMAPRGNLVEERGSSATATPGSGARPAARAAGVAQLSVTALVRQLEANMLTAGASPLTPSPNSTRSRRPPLVGHPASLKFSSSAKNSVDGGPTGSHAVSTVEETNNSNSISNINNSFCVSKINSVPVSEQSRSGPAAAFAGASAGVAFELGAPMNLEAVSKRMTVSPAPMPTAHLGGAAETRRTASYSATPVATSRVCDSPGHRPNDGNTPHHSRSTHDAWNERIMGHEKAVPPPQPPSEPSQSAIPRLTMEALLRQQQLQQQQQQEKGIVRDPQLSPSSPRLPHNVDSSRRPRPPKRQGNITGPSTDCRTTEDLLTCITVLDDARGWRDGPDSSIVLAQDTSLSRRHPAFGVPKHTY
jgi:hypothetical protein